MYNMSMAENFSFISENKYGTVISVKLVPNSSVNIIVDYNDDYIRVKICSPPIENKANKELINFFSKIFDINKSKIEIISGEKSKLKKLLFKDAKPEYVTQKVMFVLNSLHMNIEKRK